MFEDEDVILPDDYSTPQEEIAEEVPEDVVSEESVNEEVDTNETEPTEPTQEEVDAFLKIKYNKEEIPLDQERAKELAQMGMNYPKLQEKLQALESDPRLTFVEELAQRQGMNVDEFIGAFREQQEQQQLNELIQQNIPEEYAREMLENRKFRQEFQTKQQESQQQEQQQADFKEFLSYYKDANGKEFDPNKEAIPNEVLEAYQNGTPLKFAYMQHHNAQLQNQLKILKQNQVNTQRAPVGSVTAHGSTETASKDPFEMGFDSI
jgi:hypothetical protein